MLRKLLIIMSVTLLLVNFGCAMKSICPAAGPGTSAGAAPGSAPQLAPGGDIVTPGEEGLTSPAGTPVGGAAAGDHSAAAAKFENQDVLFDYDSFELSPAAISVLDAKVKYLKANPGKRVRIEGNCDERGSTEYNLALGERRAFAAKKYLVNAGVDATRLDTVSYGEERPADPGHDEAAWAKNRRDHFSVL